MSDFFAVQPNRKLGLFALVMMNVIAVGSLRSLSLAAIYGFSLVFFYALAALTFFIPSILVTAELSTTWPTTGGSYVWIRQAFGTRWGFFAVWLQWIYNVVWYPTIFSLMAATLAYLFQPSLAENKFYLLMVMLTLFWGVTYINSRGIKATSLFSTASAIIGTLFPMAIIMALSCAWIITGKTSQIDFSLHSLLPNAQHVDNIAFLSTLVFGLMGMEMSGVHAGDVHNPQKNYPRALLYSGCLILLSLMLGALAIAIVVPVEKLNLASGVIDAFAIFFKAFHLPFLTPVMAGFIVIGSLGCASAWIIGTARGMSIASQENALPAFLQKMNNNQMPVGILILQGVIFTLLCLLFLLMPSINSSFWVLSNLTAELALLFYIMLFAAAIKLRYKYADIKRSYNIPGGKFGLYCCAGLGIASSLVIFVFGFFPPSQIVGRHAFLYEMVLFGGLLLFCIFPLLFLRKKASG